MTAADGLGFETLEALLDAPVALCALVADEDGRPADIRFLRVGLRFEEAAGLRGLEGRTLLDVAPGAERSWIDRCGQAATGRAPARFTGALTGTGGDREIRVAPVGPLDQFVMTIGHPPDHRRIEAERDHARHLLRELGHRVMNSFAAISAILAMEGRAAPAEGRAALSRVQRRVQALAGLYRRLDGAPQVDRIEVSDYLGAVVTAFADSLGGSPSVLIKTDLRPLVLPTRAAVPLALILNELMTDAALQGLGSDGPGTLRVVLEEADGTCRLSMAGAGLAQAGSGVGQTLVAAFLGELGGEIATGTGPGGPTVTVTFRPEV